MVCVYSDWEGKGMIFFKGKRRLALGCYVVGASSKIVKKNTLSRFSEAVAARM